MDVIGETVVAISGRLSVSSTEFAPEPDEQAVKERIKAAAKMPYFLLSTATSYDIWLLLQKIRNNGYIGIQDKSRNSVIVHLARRLWTWLVHIGWAKSAPQM